MELTSDSDDTPSPLPHQQQQDSSQVPPPASAQATPLGRKGHSTRRNGILPSRKTTKKQSNESVKSPKGKGVGLNCSPHLVVSPFSSSSSSSSPSSTPIGRRKKNRSKGSSPLRLSPPGLSVDTPNLKVYDPTTGLKFAWDDYKKLNKSDLKSTAPPKARNLSSGVVCCLRCGMWFKSKHDKGLL